ncbi:hypothetical protein Syun_001595 [Stephania yunnanensis]|uniref:Uncharacterized protein n=1 Tax=Stephania yunnanensis TaxID=152371 RepID=A0AAP0LH00_9MAGN
MASLVALSPICIPEEEAILRDQEEREQLERNIRNRDATTTKKRRHQLSLPKPKPSLRFVHQVWVRD